MQISDTGVISEAGSPVGQLQIIANNEGEKRVQLYSKHGVRLCDCTFDGDDDKGFEIGMGMYRGYLAGYFNAEFHIGKSINAAINGKNELKL